MARTTIEARQNSLVEYLIARTRWGKLVWFKSFIHSRRMAKTGECYKLYLPRVIVRLVTRYPDRMPVIELSGVNFRGNPTSEKQFFTHPRLKELRALITSQEPLTTDDGNPSHDERSLEEIALTSLI